jgi:hypothetical protein
VVWYRALSREYLVTRARGYDPQNPHTSVGVGVVVRERLCGPQHRPRSLCAACLPRPRWRCEFELVRARAGALCVREITHCEEEGTLVRGGLAVGNAEQRTN